MRYDFELQSETIDRIIQEQGQTLHFQTMPASVFQAMDAGRGSSE
jgi:hypothetical protein